MTNQLGFRRAAVVVGLVVLTIAAACGPMGPAPSTSTSLVPVTVPSTTSTTSVTSTTVSGTDITITQTPGGPGGVCLPPILALRQSTRITEAAFTLRIEVTSPLCEPLRPVAAIYRMPSPTVVWPQTLQETLPFTLLGRGVTEVTFRRSCLPAQYDVIVGATPPVIEPFGVWHGPLLFPFDLSTSFQNPGTSNCPTTTTTSTTSTTSTTIPDCDVYTPTSLAAVPSTVAQGGTFTASGAGTAGTTLAITFQRGSQVVDPGVQVTVSPTGTFTTPVTVPVSLQPGAWNVRAAVVGCDRFATTRINVRPAQPA